MAKALRCSLCGKSQDADFPSLPRSFTAPSSVAPAPRVEVPTVPARLGRLAGRYIILVLVGLGCTRSPRTISEEERSRIESSVRAAVDGFQDAERRRDPDAILAFIEPEFYMYVDGARVDYETVAAQIRSTMPSLQRFETTWSDVEVTALARDHALVSLVFRDAVTDATGVTTRLKGPTTFVWRLRDDGWRLIYADADHYTDVP